MGRTDIALRCKNSNRLCERSEAIQLPHAHEGRATVGRFAALAMTAAEPCGGKPSAIPVSYRSPSGSVKVMPPASKVGSAAAQARTDRARLNAEDLNRVQIWVPDVHAPGFRVEAHRQSRAVAETAHDAEDQAFIDSVSDRYDE